MKLLFCPNCQDLFRLFREERSCACGKTKGLYTAEVYATTNGYGVDIGIGNGYLKMAIEKLRQAPNESREWYVKNTTVPCWVRPSEGRGNPHTVVGVREED